MIIGLSGVAGAGKDLFYSLLEQSLPCVKASLADSLKRETSEWCKEHYGIDPLRCTREEKDIIRPFLVFHGVNKRHSVFRFAYAGFQIDCGAAFLIHDSHFECVTRKMEDIFNTIEQFVGKCHFFGTVHFGFNNVNGARL